ncbi:MAG: hypothetical protein CO096_22390, partial [Armatimonadetes bacterium CG_4_9_14_3_um_filter_66_14]
MNRRAFVVTSVAASAAGALSFAADEPVKYKLPEGIKGFKGMAVGTIVKKGDQELVVKIERITKVWKANKAKDPQSIVGKEVPMGLYKKGRLYKAQLETMKILKVGDRILCEPFHEVHIPAKVKNTPKSRCDFGSVWENTLCPTSAARLP